MGKFRDIKGQTFERLTAIERVEKRNNISMWKCRCECGNETIVQLGNIVTGHTKSCGCLSLELAKINSTTHNKSHTKIHNTWVSMRTRCYKKSHKYYNDYGGRGITVCDRWLESFENFYEDMGDVPPNMSLDRKDNNQGYYKDNCRWATKQEQARNRRNSLLFDFNGEEKHLIEICEETGVKYGTVNARMQFGWNQEKAINQKTRGIWLTHNGKTQTLKQWSKETGIPYISLYERHKKGWNSDEIFNYSMHKYIEYNGQKKTFAEWEKELNLSRGILHYRIKAGWSAERALTEPMGFSKNKKDIKLQL